ncbi:MAG TPA: hypothetical protein VF784_07670 [Anaerolineales bacterium]
MKLVALTMVVLVMLVSLMTGGRLLDRSDAYVVGGTYIIRSGEDVTGNVRALFAQVVVEKGARVTGRVLALSSTLDLAGGVGGEVLAVGSDVTVRQTATLGSAPRLVDMMPYVFLFPQILRAGQGVQ